MDPEEGKNVGNSRPASLDCNRTQRSWIYEQPGSDFIAAIKFDDKKPIKYIKI